MAVNQQDVRVRFSAEGMAEVVTAFQKVSAQGKQSAKETKDAFAQLSAEFQSLGNKLLGGLSIAYVATKLTELFKSTLDNAEALTRLSRATGLSTDTIQAFGRAARESGIGSDVANAGLARLTVSLGKAQLSTGASATALAALGLKAKDLAGLTADQKLLLIAQRIAGIEDPGRRAAVATALFGKGVVELVPALVALGQQGIEPFIERMKELGIYLGPDVIAQLRAAKERMRDLEDETKGLATQLLIGLLPALKKTADELARVSGGGSVFKTIGAIAGESIRIVTVAWEGAVNLFIAGTKFIQDAIHGNIGAAFAEWGVAIQKTKDAWARVHTPDVTPPAAEPGGGGGGGGGLDANADALAKARLALTQQLLDNELKLFEAHSKLRLDEEKAAYQAGEISLKEYFARRAVIINEEYEKQIQIARRKLAAEQALPAPEGAKAEVVAEERRVQQAKLLGEIQEKTAARQAALQANDNELAQQELSIEQRKVSAEEKLLTIEGQRAAAARLRLDAETKQLTRDLAASGKSPDEQAAAVSTFRAQGGAAIDYSEAAKEGQTAMLQLETQRAAIQDKVNSGQLFEIQGQQQILALERQQLPALQANADAMLKFAQASGQQDLIASAQAFKEKLNQIAIATDTAGQRMKELNASIGQAFQSGFNSFVDAAINKTKSLGQAFDDAMKQIVASLLKAAIQMEENKLIEMLVGSLSGLGGGGASPISSADLGSALTGAGVDNIAPIVLGASGGQISGQGTSTSDSIPAMLSHGEYVVNARATSSWLPALHAINSGLSAPRYASGGFVSQLAAGGVAIRSASRRSAPPAIELHITEGALHYTLRDWLEREIADQGAKR